MLENQINLPKFAIILPYPENTFQHHTTIIKTALFINAWNYPVDFSVCNRSLTRINQQFDFPLFHERNLPLFIFTNNLNSSKYTASKLWNYKKLLNKNSFYYAPLISISYESSNHWHFSQLYDWHFQEKKL